MKVFLKYTNPNVVVGGAINTGGFSVYSGSINLGQVTHTNLVNGFIIDNVPSSANSLTLIALDPGCNGATFTVDIVYPVNSMQVVRTSNTTMKLRITFEVPTSLSITGIKTVSNGLVGGQVVWQNSNTNTTPGYQSGTGTMSQTAIAPIVSMGNKASFDIKSYTSFTGTVSATPSVISSKYISINNSMHNIDVNNSFIHNGVATIFFNITNSSLNVANFAHIILKDFRVRCTSSIYSGTNDSFTMNYMETNSFITGGDNARNVTFNAYDINNGTIRPCSFFYNFN